MNSSVRGSTTFKVLGLLALVTASLVGGVLYLLLSGRPDGAPVEIIVDRGMSGSAVSERLFQNGVIQQAGLFKLILRVTEGDKKIRAGEFRFKKFMRLIDALNVLYHGEPILHTITIPEGWRLSQIATALSANKLCDEERFLELALNPKTAEKYGFKSPSLEGYLFPTTYHFSKVDGPERLLDQMVSTFNRIYDKNYRKDAETKAIPVEQVVTMASIIEKETSVPEERTLVSSVFYNRLKKRMRLQSDPTTIYGIANFNGNLTKQDLRRYSPYNTYVIYGLPPGPIASPGEASLRAALFPHSSDYLYFVANPGGGSGHRFAKDYRVHSRNVTNTQGKPYRKSKRK